MVGSPVKRPCDANRNARTGGTVWAALLGAALLVVAVPAVHAESAAARAVATESEPASRAALSVLRTGGNAVDAAIVAALVSGVASPSSSGLGGGGFALVYTAATHDVSVLDFRETAPRNVDAAAFERRPFPSAQRGKSVGVPGELAGLAELHRRFGKKRWADLVAPAARVAREGYAVSAHLASVLDTNGARISLDANLGALFVPGGHALAAGVLVKNPLLAGTLDGVARLGASFLYAGPAGRDVAEATRNTGGALDLDDLARYAPIAREPIHIQWEGYDVYTMPPPSAGGLLLVETLSTLSAAELRKLGEGTPAYDHLLAEAMRGALADRMHYVGDPEQTPIDVQRLIAPDRMASRRRMLSLDRMHWIPRFHQDEHGTHHIVTADALGNVVSLTTTINEAFGARLTGKTTGIVLNDELDDFTTEAAARALGVTEMPNRPRPGARPVSSMTPTIVLKAGEPVLALGGSGGMAIAPNVTEVLLARLVFGEAPEKAVALPRFGVPTEGSTFTVDASTPAAFRRELARRGEIVATESSATHAVQMIAFDGRHPLPAADPRKHGAALAE